MIGSSEKKYGLVTKETTTMQVITKKIKTKNNRRKD